MRKILWLFVGLGLLCITVSVISCQPERDHSANDLEMNDFTRIAQGYFEELAGTSDFFSLSRSFSISSVLFPGMMAPLFDEAVYH